MSIRAMTSLALASLLGLSALTLPVSSLAEPGRHGGQDSHDRRGWQDDRRGPRGDGPPRRGESHDGRGQHRPGPPMRPPPPGQGGQGWHAGPPQPEWRYNPDAPPGSKWYSTPPRQHYYPPPRPPRGVGPDWRYHRGQALPPPYRGPRYQVQHWQRYGLHAPPRGHQWVRIGTDYVLMAIATGIIIDIIYGR